MLTSWGSGTPLLSTALYLCVLCGELWSQAPCDALGGFYLTYVSSQLFPSSRDYYYPRCTGVSVRVGETKPLAQCLTAARRMKRPEGKASLFGSKGQDQNHSILIPRFPDRPPEWVLECHRHKHPPLLQGIVTLTPNYNENAEPISFKFHH